jgi:hypothetical protein
MRTPEPSSLADRFVDKVIVMPDGCWKWTASTTALGYGKLGVSGHGWRPAHRVAYELFIGPIPAGRVIHHVCRNPSCVNPTHLMPTTASEHTYLDDTITRRKAGQTHCIHGHELDEKNTYIRRNGTRHCKKCDANRGRQYYRQRKASA